MEGTNTVRLQEFSLQDLLALKAKIDQEITSQKQPERQITLPLSIFRNDRLAPLESAVKYCKENLSLSYSQIASLLHRSSVCIGLTYRNAQRKSPEPIKEVCGIQVPLTQLHLSNLSLLESLVSFLQSQQFTLHNIAVLLNRNDRTIWTLAHRAKVKIHG